MIKKVRKVIIPAAGWGTRFLPLTKVVHKELVPILNKPIIHYLAEEAVASGIEELVLIISPRKFEILNYFNINEELEHELKTKGKLEMLHEVKGTNKLIKISVAIQNEQLGLGHAIYTAAEIIGKEPFAVILGDDLTLSNTPVISQLIQAYNKTGSSIIGVQTVEQANINKYGIVKPLNIKDKDKQMFKISSAIEKPKFKDAPSNKAILGRYVFTPEIMPLLKNIKPKANFDEINVVDVFEELLTTQDIFAYEFEGTRYDLGSMEGFVKANIDFALKNPDIRDSIKQHIESKIKLV